MNYDQMVLNFLWAGVVFGVILMVVILILSQTYVLHNKAWDMMGDILAVTFSVVLGVTPMFKIFIFCIGAMVAAAGFFLLFQLSCWLSDTWQKAKILWHKYQARKA